MKISCIDNNYQTSFKERIKLKPVNLENLKKVLSASGLVVAGASALEAGTSFLTSDNNNLQSLPDNYINFHREFMNSKFLNFNNDKTAPFNFQSIVPPFLAASASVGGSQTTSELSNFDKNNKNVNKSVLNTLPYSMGGSLVATGVSQIINANLMESNNIRNEQMIRDTESSAYSTAIIGTAAGGALSHTIEDLDIEFKDENDDDIPS